MFLVRESQDIRSPRVHPVGFCVELADGGGTQANNSVIGLVPKSARANGRPAGPGR